ncbi:MAG: sarcosine oxidase subunit delta [SAR202 cluster bacterium]|nr:sarcosine oxidase subunit delta [SAR202 cluster bacterium]
MAFLLTCPNCGERDVHEFRFGGELNKRPAPDAAPETWATYFYTRRNVAGEQKEWWYHSFGCRKWLIALRNTVTNQVIKTSWPEEALP